MARGNPFRVDEGDDGGGDDDDDAEGHEDDDDDDGEEEQRMEHQANMLAARAEHHVVSSIALLCPNLGVKIPSIWLSPKSTQPDQISLGKNALNKLFFLGGLCGGAPAFYENARS